MMGIDLQFISNTSFFFHACEDLHKIIVVNISHMLCYILPFVTSYIRQQKC